MATNVLQATATMAAVDNPLVPPSDSITRTELQLLTSINFGVGLLGP